MNLKLLAKKYDFEETDFDDAYYSAVRQTHKISGVMNEELLKKFLEDRLEEIGVDYRDICKLSDYYVKLQNVEELTDKLLSSNKEPRAIIEESEMQSSDGMSVVLGMSKKRPYKVVLTDPMDNEKEDEIFEMT